MSISAFPVTTDAVIGAGDIVYSNTWDQVAIDTQTALVVEHDASGIHTAYTSTQGFCAIEADTYAGDGNATQVIELTNTTLIPLFIRIWDSATTEVYFSSLYEDHPTLDFWYVWREVAGTKATGFLYDLSTTGQFTVATSLNTNLREYQYIVYGLDTLVGNGNSFTPSWAQHGEAILLDSSSNGASTRAVKQVLSRYQRYHNDDGTHKTSAFDGIAKIALVAYQGNGSTSGPSIALNFSTLKSVYIWGNGSYVLKTDNMSNNDAISLGAAGLLNNNWISFSASGFQIVTTNTAINQNSINYYAVCFMV